MDQSKLELITMEKPKLESITMDQIKLKDLVIQLYDLEAFNFYVCKTRAELSSLVYFNHEVITSNPHIMSTVSDLLTECLKQNKVDTEVLCDASYMALPVVSHMSAKTKKPILIRKESKTSGMKKLIEGEFRTGDKCLIIADVVSSGMAVVEAAKALRAEGLVVQDAIVILDQEQGGRKNAEDCGIRMHSPLTLSFVINTLRDAGRISEHAVRDLFKRAEAIQSCGDEAIRRDAVIIEIPNVNADISCSFDRFIYIGMFVFVILCMLVWFEITAKVVQASNSVSTIEKDSI